MGWDGNLGLSLFLGRSRRGGGGGSAQEEVGDSGCEGGLLEVIFLVTGVTDKISSWCGGVMTGRGGEGRGMGMMELQTVEGGKRW